MQFYNEILWFQFALVDFLAATLLFCFFKKEGLYAIIVMNIILCNIQVAKTVEMFGVVLRIWFYLTPVMYPEKILPAKVPAPLGALASRTTSLWRTRKERSLPPYPVTQGWPATSRSHPA